MTLEELSPREYDRSFRHTDTVYDTVAFADLNTTKTGHVRHLAIFKDDEGKKPLLGLTVGDKEGMLRAPFSAPFALWRYNSIPEVEQMIGATALLRRFAEKAGKALRLTLPPYIYSPTLINLTVYAMRCNGMAADVYDINHHYDLRRPGTFTERLESRTRNKLNIALKRGLRTEEIGAADFRRAYDVIADNRREKGYPLRMTADDVERTIRIIPARFFVTVDAEGRDVAACQAFRVNPRIWQIIYWGDRACGSADRPMNLLARDIIEALGADPQIEAVDIGPSSSDGVPNLGLCNFKESIGCDITLKPTFIG